MGKPILAVTAFLGFATAALAGEPVFFRLSEPGTPVALPLPGRPAPGIGRTEPLRLIYYRTIREPAAEDDRGAIRDAVRLVRDFYGHYGLDVPVESRVYEVVGEPSAPSAEQYRFDYVKGLLRRAKLYAPRRTLVFCAFDIGWGGDMAMVGINSESTRRRECPRNHEGRAPWWCGRPRERRWGGVLHEAGHLFGLRHPAHPDPSAVMSQHWRFGEPGVGLTAEDLTVLKRRFSPWHQRRCR